MLNVHPSPTVQLRNEADSTIYSTEKSLKEYKSKLPQAVVDDVNKAIAEAREASKVREHTVEGGLSTMAAQCDYWSACLSVCVQP
jgi:molecular chaperone DnaK (HSP70)